jgi:hypothetical protein
MKKEFEDKSFIEFKKSKNGIIIIMGARDSTNNLKLLVNSKEISEEEFREMVNDLQ